MSANQLRPIDIQVIFHCDKLLTSLEFVEQRFLDAIELSYLDDALPRRSEITTGELDGWLHKHINLQTRSNGKLQNPKSIFILGPSSAHLTQSLEFPYVEDYPNHILPMTELSFRKLREKLELPAATPWLFVCDSTHFHKYEMDMRWPEGRGIGFTMRLSTRGVIQMDVSASISYHAGTGAVNALVNGCSNKLQDDIRTRLQELHILGGHPLLLPVILIEEKLHLIEKEEAKLWEDLIAVERLSGETATPARRSHLPPPKVSGKRKTNEEIKEITLQVLGVLQLTPYAESHAKALLLLIQEMKSGLESVEKVIFSEPLRVEYIIRTGAMLSENLDLLAHKTQIVMNDIQFLEKRAQVQHTTVYNEMALAEARNSSQMASAAKQDSSAMKGIAILTMFFLPATFIATFFAMPILDFTADSRLPYLKHGFWLYWVIAIPLTVAVLATFALFQALVSAKHDKEDHDAAEPKIGGSVAEKLAV